MTEKYIGYDGEMTDDAPMRSIELSQHVLPYVLGALSYLKDPRIWDPNDDVESALAMVDDLCARIMGSMDKTPAYLPPSQTFIPAVAWNWYAWTNVTRDGYYALASFATVCYTDSTDTTGLAARFYVPLAPGTYWMDLWIWKGNNVCKVSVTEPTLGTIIPTTDNYQATTNSEAVVSAYFTVASWMKASFEVNKIAKNPLSSAGYLTVSAVVIRPYS